MCIIAAFPHFCSRAAPFPSSAATEACHLGVLETLRHCKRVSVSDLLSPIALCQLMGSQRKAAFSPLLASLESGFPKQQHIQGQIVFCTLWGFFYVCNISILCFLSPTGEGAEDVLYSEIKLQLARLCEHTVCMMCVCGRCVCGMYVV